MGDYLRYYPQYSFGASNGHHNRILFPQWSEQHLSRWGPFDRETLGRQLVSAADSIGASSAEGAGRTLSLDNCRFIRIARGSLHETRH